MANRIKEVYELLGIEVGDKVLVDVASTAYDATERGLRDFNLRIDNFMLTELIRGNSRYRVAKEKKPEGATLHIGARNTLYCGAIEIGKLEEVIESWNIVTGKSRVAKIKLNPDIELEE